jgi:hypothetical protein
MSRTTIRNRIVGPNVPNGERLASGILGVGLTMFGLRRQQTTLGRVALALGLTIVERAVSGSCPLYRMRTMRDNLVGWKSDGLVSILTRSLPFDALRAS